MRRKSPQVAGDEVARITHRDGLTVSCFPYSEAGEGTTARSRGQGIIVTVCRPLERPAKIGSDPTCSSARLGAENSAQNQFNIGLFRIDTTIL